MEDTAIDILAESERFSLWRTEESDGDMSYHLEFGPVTVHLFDDEWEEFLDLIGDMMYASEG